LVHLNECQNPTFEKKEKIQKKDSSLKENSSEKSLFEKREKILS